MRALFVTQNSIAIPIKNFGKNENWLLLNNVLGKRIIFRADSITKDGKRPKDFDGHECDQASALSSVKCKTKDIFINDKIFKK